MVHLFRIFSNGIAILGIKINFQVIWLFKFWTKVWSVSSVQFLSCVQLFVTPWTAPHQASLSITNSQSLFKLMSTESVMPSNHLIFCHPLLLQPSIFPSIRVFSNESVLHIRWPKYCSFSFSTSPSNEYSGLPMNIQDWFALGWTGWISLQSKGLSRVWSFHMPLTLLHQRADRLKITITGNEPIWSHGPQFCLTQWNYEVCCVGPPKMDGSWWRVLMKCGPLEKGMANHFSILALRTP